jgi:UDP:flavonoid glycosyltransferase YjiC (YdhE family)
VTAPGSARKVLFVAEAVTLAHVVRPVTLARSLHEQGWDVTLATDPRYERIVGPLPFKVESIHTMPPQRFHDAITHGSPIFDFPTLDRYVADELALLDRLRPHLVVGDFRISLAVSARLARIPYVNVTNAYWSPLAKIRHVVPEFAWVRRLGLPAAQWAFSAFERIGYALHAVPVNRVRRKYGLPAIGSDFRDALMDGDVTCFADLPEIIPTAPLPPNQCFIGPVPWSPPGPPPPWWEQVRQRDAGRPLVYVTLGSSGPAGVLQNVLDGLAGLPVDVIASTAGRAEALRVPPNARVADLLPGDLACAAADLVICNGGSPSTYQALAHGKPVIGIATNMDQFLNMAAVEDAGCGRLLRSRLATANTVKRAVATASEGKSLAAKARRHSSALTVCAATEALAKIAFETLQA